MKTDFSCPSCGSPIVWARVQGESQMVAFDAQPSPRGDYRVGHGDVGKIARRTVNGGDNLHSRHICAARRPMALAEPARPVVETGVPTDINRHQPFSSIDWITPQMASDLLASRGPDHRRVRMHKIKEFTRLIAEHRWPTGSSAIVIDWNGQLIDGQHRLAACVEAGEAFRETVVRNVDPANVAYIDMGTPRNMSDAARIAGVSRYSDGVAAVTRALMQWEYDVVGVRKRDTIHYFDRHDEIDFMSNHLDELEVAAKDGYGLRVDLGLHAGVWGAFAFRARGINSAATDAFITSLRYGVNLKADDPIYALRQWVLRQDKSRPAARSAQPQRDQLVAAIKTWNLYVTASAAIVLKTKDNKLPVMVRPGAAVAS